MAKKHNLTNKDSDVVSHETKIDKNILREIALKLEGTPKKLRVDKKYLEKLCNIGVAINLNDEGYARGYKWHKFIKTRI